MSVFFKIGNTDLTPWVDIQNYAVNVSPVYSSWTDANDTEHRTITRTRIAGTVVLGFRNQQDFNTMRYALLTDQTDEGSYPVTCFVNNTGTVFEGVDAFIDVAAENKWDLVNDRQWTTVTLTIRER